MLKEYAIQHYSSVGQRINEIMEERGIKVAPFAKATGISRTTLNRILGENRAIEADEMQSITAALKLTSERIKMTDNEKQEKLLNHLIDTNTLPNEALSIALDLLSVSIGATEHMVSLIRLGMVYAMFSDKKEQAEDHFKRAIKYANTSGNVAHQQLAVVKLASFYIDNSKFQEVCVLNKEYESILAKDSDVMVKFQVSLGVCAFHQREYEKAIESWSYAKQLSLADDPIQVGRICNNIAEAQFELGAYHQSFETLKEARDYLLKDSIKYKIILAKGFSKVLIQLKQFEKALVEINSGLSMIESSRIDMADIHAKLMLHKSIIKRDATIVEKALDFKGLSKQTLYTIGDYLSRFYGERGEYEKAHSFYDLVADNSVVGLGNLKNRHHHI